MESDSNSMEANSNTGPGTGTGTGTGSGTGPDLPPGVHFGKYQPQPRSGGKWSYDSYHHFHFQYRAVELHLYALQLQRLSRTLFLISTVLNRQGAVVTYCGDSLPLGPGDVYELTSPNYPRRYYRNQQ